MSTPLGELLRHWRRVRRMSQLALAHHAQVSPRHLSFVESGRSTPSREWIMTLAGALQVPLRERNDLLLAAGYAPLYRESAIAEPAMATIRAALDRVLAHHEPYPAVVMDRHWNLTQANRSAEVMFARLRGTPPATASANVIRLMFDPRELRPHVANWDEVAPALIQRVHREAVGGIPDATTRALLEEVLPPGWRELDRTAPLVPVIPVTFAKDGLTVSYFSMITTVGTPQDITAQELRVESFYPADRETERHRWT
ncbi:helix-turn-helix domain-containing protein [Nonomuraea rubra]|uniref:Transcriptional regulator with XRE-family HTH domain n=2 Tax=Nonomuraea rubra TaxID=46180 RepID=A0A7X0U459_9ACTN|nr:helix-turn-helix transcriptional regulator [Nonomuraea rubra]MBB6554145.1 transcriptional regulator with XRE-family HTH domain [Nonomuraea rubra]